VLFRSGQTIRIGQAPFRVIGVLESKGQSSMGQDQDDLVIVPLNTAQERLMGITYLHNISVQVSDESVIDRVQNDITTLLRTRHRLAEGTENDFSVRNLTAIMETMKENTNTITLLLGNIAAISLLVGGIGIMNIMLVSVTERTREIGIRKALGAKFRDILLQFLIEAIFLSVTGGLFGVLLGVAGAYAISAFAGWDTVVSWLAIIAAFSVSVIIGLFFGIYPASKAAKLNPIDALRYE
jgi:putative ABC transport system permease protein